MINCDGLGCKRLDCVIHAPPPPEDLVHLIRIAMRQLTATPASVAAAVLRHPRIGLGYRCETEHEECDRPAFKPRTPDGQILCTKHWRELVDWLSE